MRRERARDLGDAIPAHLSFICACGKRGYRSERLAKDAHKSFPWRIRTYRCPESGSYHATNHEKGA